MARRRAQVDAIARALLARDSHAAEPQSEMSTSITSREQPRLVLIAGVNGAGKTTFATRPGAAALLNDVRAINPDVYTQDVRTRFRLSLRAANILAVVQTELEAWQAIAQHRSVAIETVLSSSKYLPLVQTARRRGFETVLIYTGLPSVRFSVARVAARVQAGGHNVPRRKLLERWGRSLDNFVTFMAHCDEVVLFSNAGSEPVLVGNRTAGGPFNLYEPNELPEITARLRSAGLVP